MKNIIAKICLVMSVLCIAILIQCIPVKASSDNACWVSQGNDVWTLQDEEGTNLQAKLVGKTLAIGGVGDIPNYDLASLGNRPWNNRTIYSIVIEGTVNSIGAYAFCDFEYLHDVSFYTNTFVDYTAFNHTKQGYKGIIIYIKGNKIVDGNIGRISFNSIDALTSFMKTNNGRFRYNVEDGYITSLIQSKVDPDIMYLASGDLNRGTTNSNYPIVDYRSKIEIIGFHTTNITEAYIYNNMQGVEALKIFDAFMGDSIFATSYNVDVFNKTNLVKQIGETLQLKITIPNSLNVPGRKYKLIQIIPGKVNVLEDEDNNDGTITVSTDYPSSTYALVYDN